jgi:hypothetical protein
MTRFPLKSVLLFVTLALAACANANPPAPTLPPVSFADKPPFVLNVARIEIVSQFVTPSGAPHIEIGLPVTPENAIRRWIQDRMQPRGTNGTLRVVIRDASAIETAVPKDPNATSAFGDQPTTKVAMSVEVSLELLDDRQFVTAEVSGKASRSQTLLNDIKLNERDKILYDMAIDVVRGWGDEISPRISTNFHNQLLL